MKINRRLVIGLAAFALLAGAVWVWQRLTFDDRSVTIDIQFGGANSEFAFSSAQLPLYGSYDVGLGYFTIALSATAEGLIVDLKRSAHEFSWPGDLVFYTLDTQIIAPINGSQEVISIYDTTKPAVDGGEGPLFVGNLKLTSTFGPPF